MCDAVTPLPVAPSPKFHAYDTIVPLSVEPAPLKLTTSGGAPEVGFAEITADAVTVLVERAFITDEADHRQVERELKAAEAALETEQDDEARRHLNKALEALRTLSRAA